MNEKIEEYICNVKIRALQMVKTPEIKYLRRILDIENVKLITCMKYTQIVYL